MSSQDRRSSPVHRPTAQTERVSDRADAVKDATVVALKRVLDPLLELMLDAGLTVKEFTTIVRDRAVHVGTARVLKESGRESRSRVAIMTGLPRSEVTRILAAADTPTSAETDRHPARRILAAWHDNADYLAANGEPAIIPIFGKKRSFERLVDRYGGGLPVRAMLDELTQLDAVERLEAQRVRAKARVPVLRGLTTRSIAAVGERGRDLLETLAHNVRRSTQPLFEATALLDDGDADMATLVRREITEQGTNFINSATSLLNRTHRKRNAKAAKPNQTCRLGVTVFYFQELLEGDHETTPTNRQPHRRKNLRRRNAAPQKPNPATASE